MAASPCSLQALSLGVSRKNEAVNCTRGSVVSRIHGIRSNFKLKDQRSFSGLSLIRVVKFDAVVAVPRNQYRARCSPPANGEEEILSPEVNTCSSEKPSGIWMSDVVVKKKPNYFKNRVWTAKDLGYAGCMAFMHGLCLSAPATFSWNAFAVFMGPYATTGLLGITLSFHRNLSHKSFKVPKWLEYTFAYCGVQAIQVGARSNVADMEKDAFYQFTQKTYPIHPIAMAVALYAVGGIPHLIWGMAVRVVWVYYITWFVNSVSYVWGSLKWNTGDLSRNNWWVALLAFGEGWHKNHHAFEYSARHGLEWWQLDPTWWIIRSLEAVGLATKVRLPKNEHMEKLAY